MSCSRSAVAVLTVSSSSLGSTLARKSRAASGAIGARLRVVLLGLAVNSFSASSTRASAPSKSFFCASAPASTALALAPAAPGAPSSVAFLILAASSEKRVLKAIAFSSGTGVGALGGVDDCGATCGSAPSSSSVCRFCKACTAARWSPLPAFADANSSSVAILGSAGDLESRAARTCGWSRASRPS
jgi:hypothetical protein